MDLAVDDAVDLAADNLAADNAVELTTVESDDTEDCSFPLVVRIVARFRTKSCAASLTPYRFAYRSMRFFMARGVTVAKQACIASRYRTPNTAA